MVTDEEKARIMEFCAFVPAQTDERNEWLRTFEGRRVEQMIQVLNAVRMARDVDGVITVPCLVRDGMTRAAARRVTKGLKKLGFIVYEEQSPGQLATWLPVP